MNKRESDILNDVMGMRENTSISYLADKYNVTQRTIRNDFYFDHMLIPNENIILQIILVLKLNDVVTESKHTLSVLGINNEYRIINSVSNIMNVCVNS